VGGLGGVLVGFVLLVAFAGLLYHRSRVTAVHAGNVNAEWTGTVAPPTPATTSAAA
jgi:PiT family inorganic phosphate transporter